MSAVGLIVVFGCVFGVFVAHGGDLAPVIHAAPWEFAQIGGAAFAAMLIGNGPTDLNRISMVGNDMQLDTGIGTCGKNGQGVPVGVGQPTLRIDGLTVGGTAAAA